MFGASSLHDVQDKHISHFMIVTLLIAVSGDAGGVRHQGCEKFTFPPSVLVPDQNCPRFLKGRNQRAGLGHSFMSYHSLVLSAAANNLTLNGQFVTDAHGLNPRCVTKFFFKGLFNHSASKTKKIRVEDLAKLDAVVQMNADACNVTFDVRKPARPSYRMNRNDVCFYREILPQFSICFPHVHNSPFLVAVHIRRGDAGRNAKRMARNKAYISLLKKIVELLANSQVHILLAVEGAPSPYEVPDYGGNPTNFVEHFPGCNVSLVPDDALQTFQNLCRSDIFITSRSGFSHLVAILCSKPVVLALPFWLEYSMPNALPVIPSPRSPVLPVEDALLNNVTDFLTILMSHRHAACDVVKF